MLIIQQVNGGYQCKDPILAQYCKHVQQLRSAFEDISFCHVYREDNQKANDLAQMASGYKDVHADGCSVDILEVSEPSYAEEFLVGQVNADTVTSQGEDWRNPLKQFLLDPAIDVDPKIRRQAVRYILIDGQLYRKTEDEVFLRCVSEPESALIMHEVHEGLCGAHQSGRRMVWLIKRYGYFWPTLVQDCILYAKRCQECQKHGPVQRIPAAPMNIIVKPWPFRAWAMDVIGMVFPPSVRGHRYILLATDYFTKWVEAVPLKEVDQGTVIQFVKEHIIYRFGIPETIVSDQAQYFTGKDLAAYANEMGIGLTHSSPYFAQGNG